MTEPIATQPLEAGALGRSVTVVNSHRLALTVSIVAYGSDVRPLARTLGSLAAAADTLPGGRDSVSLVMVDNGPYGPKSSAALSRLLNYWEGRVEVLSGQGNVGYGRGHNIAIGRSPGAFHLVLNPDVELAHDSLAQSLRFMEDQPDCGLLAPAVRDEGGELQYLCKRYPTVLDLLLRGFAPRWMSDRFRARLDRYEMRDLINTQDLVWDPPIVSGCFMFFRTEVLKAVGGFDPRFFLYFEDFDLSLRTTQAARIAYVPAVRIVHLGGGAARKGLSHVRMFTASAVRFFRTQGWRWF